MKNQRKNDRLSCLVPVEGKEETIFSQIHTIDLSRGGLGLISSYEIPINQEIAIELDLEADGDPVFVVGRVKWIKLVENKYRVGMEFEDILPGSKSRLDKYFQQKD